MTDQHTAVLALIIQADRDNAVDRYAISAHLARLGMPLHVRDVQTVVAELQAMGHRIVSANHGRSPRTGYWIARYAEDAEYCREAAHRLYKHASNEVIDADMLMRWSHELEHRPRPQQIEALFA